MGNKEREIVIDDKLIIGIISLIFGGLFLISEILMFSGIITPSGNPITSTLLIIGFFYTAYKTLIKKEELTKTEWIAFAVLLGLVIVGLIR